jgi:CheY-like chemotaxis protein
MEEPAMRMDDMIIISVDDHTIEPADMFERHTRPSMKGKMPYVTKKNGFEAWVFEDRAIPNLALNAVQAMPHGGVLRIRAEAAWPGRRVPIVALTADALDTDRQRCFDCGMDDFMTKPVTIAMLASVIRRWSGRAQAPSPSV